jgi:hypothetical protein
VRIARALFVVLSASVAAAQEVHYSPEEKLDAIDAGLIASAARSIDFASYSLTDSAVLECARSARARRRAHIRDHGAKAYGEARRCQREALDLDTAARWRRVASAVAMRTGRRVGLDTATRMLMSHDE